MAQGGPPPQVINLRISGLYTNPSTFTQVPPGALSVADNIVIDRENFAFTRRGMFRYGTGFDSTGVQSLFNYANTLIAHDQNTHLWYDSNDNGAWVQYTGSFPVPDVSVPGSRVRSFESNKNLYFITSNGTFKLDSVTNEPRLAGAPQALGGTGSTTGASGFMTTNTNVAYRIVWGYKDAQSNLILGAPSQRIVVSNTAGADRNISLTFQIPAEIDTTWFYQIYRSLPSPDLTTEPNDELQQTIEGVPTSAEISARFVTVTDSTPDSLLQQYLYTNPSQGGILLSNFRPPFAMDACTFKGYSFYANTRTAHMYSVNLLSSEPPVGLQVGDTVTFTLADSTSTFTLTGNAAEVPASGLFQVFNTGNPATDIENTSLSLLRVLNVYAANTFLDGYYLSDYQGIPGQLQFNERTLSSVGFFMNSSRTTAWTPSVAATGTNSSSTNDLAPSRVYYSSSLQPEAVPVLNWFTVGNLNQPIQRIVPVRDGIIVLKPDGIYNISGSAGQWAVQGVDNTVRIIAPNTAVALDNQVFMLSDQGVVAATTSAAQIMSRPIERTILQLTSPTQYPNTADLAFAVPYSADRKYILNLPVTGTDAYCQQQYCYNTVTNTWTRWTRPSLCGLVNIRDDKLYFGGPSFPVFGGAVYKERKTFTVLDMADEEFALTVTARTSLTITVADVSNVQVGMTITQESSASSGIVTSIVGNVITLSHTNVWTLGTAIAYAPIDAQLKTVQLDCENPGMMKQFKEVSFIYSEANFKQMQAYFSSDVNGGEVMQTLRPPQQGSWGGFNWGEVAWGGNVVAGQCRIRTLVPTAQQRANWLYIRLALKQCFTSFGISGFSAWVNWTSARQRQAGDR